MIPDFKTFIGESVWGDLRKRSSGEVTRKEDDVNSFNSEDLFDYLKKNYEYKYPTVFTNHPSSGGTIYVRLYSEPVSGYDTVLMYNHIDRNRELSISGGFKRNAKDIYNEMCKKYQLTFVNENDPDGEQFVKINIAPNDGKDITNKFFLEILDFIIERVEEPLEREVYKKHINESVWGDLRKRSSGEVTRREDDVNLLSQDELFDYINDHYVVDKFVIDNDHKPIDKTNSIHVPFAIPEEYSYGYGINLEFKKKEKVITFSSDLKNELPDVYNKLCENYNVKAITRFLSTISPLDGSEITNKFYIELIDFLIDIVDEEHKIIKRK